MTSVTDHDERLAAGTELDASSAMVRAESEHLDATLHALVSRLSSVPALQMTVSYRQGRLRRLIGDLPYVNDLHRGTDAIEEIHVTLGPRSYWLRSGRDSIRCCKGASVDLGAQSEESFSDWASGLFQDIAQQNLINHESLAALRRLVEQDQVG